MIYLKDVQEGVTEPGRVEEVQDPKLVTYLKDVQEDVTEPGRVEEVWDP